MKKMKDIKTVKKKCEKCKKATPQVNTSEGFAGTIYYEDWTCTVCGKVNLFEKKNDPKFVTEYCVY